MAVPVVTAWVEIASWVSKTSAPVADTDSPGDAGKLASGCTCCKVGVTMGAAVAGSVVRIGVVSRSGVAVNAGEETVLVGSTGGGTVFVGIGAITRAVDDATAVDVIRWDKDNGIIASSPASMLHESDWPAQFSDLLS